MARTKDNEDDKEPIPVTILSGFLGSGKTTLLKRILESPEHGLKIAVIVNDMAELNIDADVVSRQVVQTTEEIVSLANGCICCTLRGDLIREINRIRDTGDFDYVVVESTGIAEPQQVAESFAFDPETADLAEDPSKMLWNIAKLDTCVTLLDANEFDRHLRSLKRFKEEFSTSSDSKIQNDEEGQKSIANLLVEQVEFANIILINKIDLVSVEKRDLIIQLVKALNPTAKLVTTKYADVDLNDILNTNTFNLQEAEQSPGWLLSLKNETSEADEYGISSFVYRARKPFHPGRLFQKLNQILHFAEHWNQGILKKEGERNKKMLQSYGQLFRSKGHCWIAGRDAIMGGWAHSGRILSIHPTTRWYVDIPQDEWDLPNSDDGDNDEQGEIDKIKDLFEGEFGDKRQEIVFIGSDLKVDAIQQTLDECLLSEKELKLHLLPKNRQCYHDLLPPWMIQYDAPGIVTTILRHGQNHLFQVSPGLQFTLSNLALNINFSEDDDLETYDNEPVVVKIWLDTMNLQRSSLLATLRDGVNDQQMISVTIPGEEQREDEGPNEMTTLSLRAELRWSGTKRKHNATVSKSSNVEVHVVGSVMPLPMIPVDEEIGGEEDDQEAVCVGPRQ